jgi:hypothetical protein
LEITYEILPNMELCNEDCNCDVENSVSWTEFYYAYLSFLVSLATHFQLHI